MLPTIPYPWLKYELANAIVCDGRHLFYAEPYQWVKNSLYIYKSVQCTDIMYSLMQNLITVFTISNVKYSVKIQSKFCGCLCISSLGLYVYLTLDQSLAPTVCLKSVICLGIELRAQHGNRTLIMYVQLCSYDLA